MTAFLYIQEGGSSTEYYTHVFNTRKQAERMRKSAARAAYRTSEIIEIPANVEELGAWVFDFFDEVLQLVPTIDYPET